MLLLFLLNLVPNTMSWLSLDPGEIELMGFIISNGTIKPDKRLVQSICELRIPRNIHEVKMVTGLFNFFRHFISQFAIKCTPLDELKKLDTKFIWTEKHQFAFDELKSALCNYPILRIPNLNKPFILDTDASTIGIGGILQQLDDDINKL